MSRHCILIEDQPGKDNSPADKKPAEWEIKPTMTLIEEPKREGLTRKYIAADYERQIQMSYRHDGYIKCRPKNRANWTPTSLARQNRDRRRHNEF